MVQLSPDQSILALDVGEARIGVARAGIIAKLPEPLRVIEQNTETFSNLKKLLAEHNIGLVVVGLPRNLKGEETQQSQHIRNFVNKLKEHIAQEIVFVDESLSSKRADVFLNKHSKVTASQDSIAACFILEEFFITMEGQHEILA